MKKNLLLIVAILFSAVTVAQTLDFTKDGRHYYIASPNGRYFTGTVNEGPGCFLMQIKNNIMQQNRILCLFMR